MADDEVTAKPCKVCNNILASNLERCIHCGAANPIKEEKKDPPLWPWILASIVLLLFLLSSG